MVLNLLQNQLNHGATTICLLYSHTPLPQDKVKYMYILNYFNYASSNLVTAEKCSNLAQVSPQY